MDPKKNILIVDDNENFLKIAVLKIRRIYNEANFITAKSGRDALDILGRHNIDLLITDVFMPEINGFDLLIRARKLRPGLKVIMMTAYYSQELHEKAFNYGSLAYIEKPFQIEALVELIRRSFDEKKKRFTGEMLGIEISDIIQLNCIAKLNNVIFLNCDKREGAIYFEKGEIVHAEYDGFEGEAALKEILGFEGGSFSTKKITSPPKKTISKKWQQLLLELMVSIDESRRNVRVSHNLTYVENREETGERQKGIDKKVRILVVDDSKISTKMITDILSSDPEIEVIGDASNGKEALTLVRQLRPDIITMDIQMPFMDGITTLKKIMLEQPTPVVIVTGFSNDEKLKSESLNSGAADYIHKSAIENALKDMAHRKDFIDRIKGAGKSSRDNSKIVNDL